MKTGSHGGCQSSVRSRKQKATEKYDGYSACPILTEYGETTANWIWLWQQTKNNVSIRPGKTTLDHMDTKNHDITSVVLE